MAHGTFPIMVLFGMLSFVDAGDDACLHVSSAGEYWMARYPTLADAITAAFINNLLNSEEACEALAVKRRLSPWEKALSVDTFVLQSMGLQRRLGAYRKA